MKSFLPLALCSLIVATALTAVAQEEKAAPKAPGLNTPKVPPKEELEATFKKTMTKATFNGRWSAIKNGELSPERSEKYTIIGVNKVGNDVWIINSRIQYGNKDVTVPIPVYVKWAGDTAVIQVTDFSMPGGGTYSARVLVYNNTYAGTWSGGDHGGLLNGVITQE